MAPTTAEVDPDSLVVGPASATVEPDGSPTAESAGPAAVSTSSPPSTLSWHRPIVDVAAAVVAVGSAQALAPTLPVVATLLLVAGWPLALALAGYYAVQPIAEPARARRRRVLRSAAGLALATWGTCSLAGVPVAPALLAPAVASLAGAGLLASALPASRRVSRILVAGSPREARMAVSELVASGTHEVVAVCVPAEDEELGNVPVHVGLDDVVAVARRSCAHAVLAIPGPDLPPEVLRRLQWDATGLHVYIGTGLLDVDPGRVSLAQAGGLDLLHVRRVPTSGPSRFMKGTVDRLIAAAALCALLPVLLLVAAIIRNDSPGSPIFRQTRVGRGGREFTMYKFRTMATDAERVLIDLSAGNECDQVLFKIRADPRVTRPGAFLRRYSIDELPQLWNVLIGDMSLVGPRPALRREVDLYDLDPRRRLAVKPGLTGLWQVSGRSDLTWAESVRLDVKYVDNWSLAHDLSILRRTVRAVLSHRGAY